MAGDWLPVRLDLASDPAVILITAKVESVVDEDHCVGKLVKFWSWANAQLRSCNADVTPMYWIDRYVGAPGFAQAMVDAGWLEPFGDGIRIPNWDRWNSQAAKRRILTARRVQKSRAEKCNADVTLPALQKRYQRREEKSKREYPPIAPPDDAHHDARKTPFAEAVARIWSAYPRKVGKQAALRKIEVAIRKIRGRGEADPAGWLLARVEKYAKSPAGNRGEFTPHPATWFGQGRYDDDDSEWQRERDESPVIPRRSFAAQEAEASNRKLAELDKKIMGKRDEVKS